MSFGSEIDSALASIALVTGLSTVTIGGVDYACFRKAARNRKDMAMAGYFEQWDDEITVRGSVLGVSHVPAVNTTVTLDGRTCRVAEVLVPTVKNGSDAAFYRLRLKDVT